MQTLEKHGQSGWQPKDAELEHAVKNAFLRHPKLQLQNLRILVKDRKVTLFGIASNRSDINQAAIIASTVVGVKELENKLESNPPL